MIIVAVLRVVLAITAGIGLVGGVWVDDWAAVTLGVIALILLGFHLKAESYWRENRISEEQMAAFDKEYRK